MRRPLQVLLVGASALCVILILQRAAGKTEVSVGAEKSAPIEIASIELPRPEPRASEREPPEPSAQLVEAPRQSAALRLDPEALARGDALLRAGVFPRLRATYVRIGFPAYREAVVALGGAFYLYDARARQTLVEVDPHSGSLGSGEVRGDLSRWPRDVTRYLDRALQRGRERYGERVSRVVLLPPASVDAALLGALDQRLAELGLHPNSLLRVDVAYELRSGRLHCEVLAVALRDGSERDLGLWIDLSERGGG